MFSISKHLFLIYSVFPFFVKQLMLADKNPKKPVSIPRWNGQNPQEDFNSYSKMYIPVNVNNNHWFLIVADFNLKVLLLTPLYSIHRCLFIFSDVDHLYI